MAYAAIVDPKSENVEPVMTQSTVDDCLAAVQSSQ